MRSHWPTARENGSWISRTTRPSRAPAHFSVDPLCAAARFTPRLATWMAPLRGSPRLWFASVRSENWTRRAQRSHKVHKEVGGINMIRDTVIGSLGWSLSVLCVSFVFFVSPSFTADPPGIAVDKEKKTITIDAKIAPRKLDYLDQIYPIEVVACYAHPKGEKAHETLVTIEAKPSDVHK